MSDGAYGPGIRVSDVIRQRQAALNLSDLQLAQALGYERRNVISMIRGGTMNLPIEKVLPLTRLLGLDPWHFLVLLLRTDKPEVLQALIDCIGPEILNGGKLGGQS